MLVLLTFLGLFCFENIPSTLIICGVIAHCSFVFTIFIPILQCHLPLLHSG